MPINISKLEKIDNIPCYVENLNNYASEVYYLYSQLINNNIKRANQLEEQQSSIKETRKVALKNIREAIIHNLKTLKGIQASLEPYIDPKILVTFRPNPTDDLTGYLKDFRYLKRDWSWEKSSEDQLSIIHKALLSGIEKSECDSALFLGGGVGRIAYDLADSFKKIYITDKSFSMAYHFDLLLKEDIEFYEIDYKNIYNSSDSVRKIKATLFPEHLNVDIDTVKNRIAKMNYFIADVIKLPFPDNSVSTIFSVYFTDVIALKLWMPEIIRVLKNGGQFIHFGPLDYFFSDPTEMLAPNEIKDVFSNAHFESLHDELINTVHLPLEKNLVNKVYTNWLYVAKKNEIPLKKKLELNTEVQLNPDGIEYTIKVKLTPEDQIENFELAMPNSEIYEGAKSAIDIIKLTRTKISITNILNKFEAIHGELDKEDTSLILQLIEELLLKKVLIKVNDL